LQKRHFDVVVVDEASQITVPASIGALYRAGKFVLVGVTKAALSWKITWIRA
jgi:superfamily I DNA and/or RNA helicase